ncbi:MAG: hypothetical protein MI723_12885, partial [Caulobacterales bacterium]|nr:hypothetical protein [Caulobacterales bacterium]
MRALCGSRGDIVRRGPDRCCAQAGWMFFRNGDGRGWFAICEYAPGIAALDRKPWAPSLGSGDGPVRPVRRGRETIADTSIDAYRACGLPLAPPPRSTRRFALFILA